MFIIAAIISFILVALAALHTLWGFGYWVPIRDEETLVRTVIGGRDVTRMPGAIPCGLVAASLIVTVCLIWGGQGAFRSVLLALSATVFICRGVLAYSKFWRKMSPQEPFATYDRRYYGPLCLALGLGLVVLI